MKGVARHLVGTLPNGFLRDGCTSETCSTPHARCPRAAVERRDATTCQVGSRAAARCSLSMHEYRCRRVRADLGFGEWCDAPLAQVTGGSARGILLRVL